jgi:hypothetical protein
LNRQQIATLFGRDVKTIGKHISNALNEELEGIPTVANFAIVHFEGKRKVKRNIEFYNLDVVLSVGYRVKSKQGIHFRIWANRVLTNHLLEGFTINNRINQLELKLNKGIGKLTQRVDEIEIFVSTNELPTRGIFFEGQLFDAYVFINNLIKSANKSIILIDNYVDESTLLMLSKRNPKCNTTIYTQKLTAQLQLDLAKHNEQYPRIDIKTLKTAHDRFLILDRKEVYHIGASLKDLGKKWFGFSKLNEFLPSILEKLND